MPTGNRTQNVNRAGRANAAKDASYSTGKDGQRMNFANNTGTVWFDFGTLWDAPVMELLADLTDGSIVLAR